MSRWAPNARERLQEAALELFAESGYDETTVAQIAERAGLNRATFFRHFADKREVLFGEDVVGQAMVEGVESAAQGADAVACMGSALAGGARVMTAQQRSRAIHRLRIAATNDEVRERGLLKNARTATTVAAALRGRGLDDLSARLGAEMVILAFGVALREWVEGAEDTPFAQYASPALESLRVRARALGADG